MKIFIFSLLLFTFSSTVFSQDAKVDELLSSISDKWKKEDDNIFVQKTIELEGKKKDDIFNIILEFLSKNYRDANSVIQTKDKESGLIIGKGNSSFYVSEIFMGSSVKQTVYHIFKAEAREGKVRITISANTVEQYIPPTYGSGLNVPASTSEYPLTNCYPINIAKSKSGNKRSGYVFFKSVNGLIELLSSCEYALMKSNSLINKNDDF